jgi:hypothetical protein
MDKNTKVTILQGFGYEWNDNGIMRYRRTESNINGVIIDLLPKQQLYIRLEDGRKVITGKNCVEVVQS